MVTGREELGKGSYTKRECPPKNKKDTHQKEVHRRVTEEKDTKKENTFYLLQKKETEPLLEEKELT